MVLKHVRCNDKFMGGVWIIAAGDHYQCGPVDDFNPPLTSLLVKHNFDVIKLEYLFRARKDEPLQNLIYTMRVPEIPLCDIEKVIRVLKEKANMVTCKDDVPWEATWFLATNEAVKVIVSESSIIFRHHPAKPIMHFKIACIRSSHTGR